MSRVLARAAARFRGALPVVLGAVLALVLPTALMAPADGSTLALAVLAIALVALLGPGMQLAAVAVRSAATTLPAGEQPTPVRTGRVTDPVHHPLRPRAPGMA